MKILGYRRAHALKHFEFAEFEVSAPEVRPHDVLVRVKAISVNPVDTKIRANRNTASDRPVILGWDASGVIEKVGPEVNGFKVGDEVFYAGELMRDGSYAELQAVDYRIVAKKPKSLSFEQAASMPLTSLTAWEALLERKFDFTDKTHVLIIGGAGGVGSMAIQLLKTMTKAKVIATASRAETREWCLKLGADFVIDHNKHLPTEFSSIGLDEVDIVFGTTQTFIHQSMIPNLLRPFGHFVVIDDPGALDVTSFKTKALTIHWELMFTKTLFNYNIASQGEILKNISKLVDEGKIKPTINRVMKGLTADNIREAHRLLEDGAAVGKIVITLGF